MCDEASIKSAITKVQDLKKSPACAKRLVEGTYGARTFCGTTTGFFESKEGADSALRYRLGFAPDRIKEIEKNYTVDWTRLNFQKDDFHFPMTENRDLLSQAAFRADKNAWKPQTVLQRGELPGGMRNLVDWRFIGGIPPVANGRVLVKSRRRSVNFKNVTQCGSTCMFAGFRNTNVCARPAELGEFSRIPELGNVASATIMNSGSYRNKPSGVMGLTVIDVYRTLDDRDCYIWKNSWNTSKDICTTERINEGDPQKTFFEVKTDPTTREVLNKDYALSSEGHNYVLESRAPDTNLVNRAFTSHERTAYYSEEEPEIDWDAYLATNESASNEQTYPTVQESKTSQMVFELNTDEVSVGSRSTSVDWPDPNLSAYSAGMTLDYYVNKFQVDPNIKPYVDSRYLPTVMSHKQTTLCGCITGLSCDNSKAETARKIYSLKKEGSVCGKDKNVPLLYLQCYNGVKWFPFQVNLDLYSTDEKQQEFINKNFGKKAPYKNRGFFHSVSYSIAPTNIDRFSHAAASSHLWITSCKNNPVFSLGELAEASPSLFIMMMIDELGPVCMSRTGLVGGSSTCYDAMAKQAGISIADAAHIPHPEYLIDGSGSQTDLAMRKILMYYRPAPYAEAYHPGSSSGHTFVICGYHFIPSAPEDSYYICQNSHWENGTTFRGALLIKINFLHAWAGQHLIERDATCWNYDLETKTGGFGRPVKYYYDGTAQLPGHFADSTKIPHGKFMGDTNEVRGASKYNYTLTGDYDPSGETLAFVGNGFDEHCGVGMPTAAEGDVTPATLPNFRAMRLTARVNARAEDDFASYSYSTCGPASSLPIKTQQVTNQTNAADLCTLAENCNFVAIDADNVATFYESCLVDNDDTGATVLQRRSTIVEDSQALQIIEKYYGNYQDVCLTTSFSKYSDWAKALAVPSGYRLINGPGCTNGSSSTASDLSVCAKKCTGDCSYATFDAKNKKCNTCTGVYLPTTRGPCDLITVIPVPRGAAPNVTPSEYPGFNRIIGHHCSNQGFINTVAVDTSATTLEKCATACYNNVLCQYAQMQEGLCTMLDVCTETYPTDDDNLQALVRNSVGELPDGVTYSDGRAVASVQPLSILPLGLGLILGIPLIIIIVRLIPQKVPDPRNRKIAQICLSLLAAALILLGIGMTTSYISMDLTAVQTLEAKQFVGVA